jgi:hypothetical protein
MTASVGGYFCLHVMVLHSGMLLMFDRMLGGDDGQRVDAFRNLPPRSDQRITSGHARQLKIARSTGPALVSDVTLASVHVGTLSDVWVGPHSCCLPCRGRGRNV